MRASDKCTLAAFQFLMIFLVKEKLAFVLAERTSKFNQPERHLYLLSRGFI